MEATRQLYWNIHGKGIMYFLALISVMIFIRGCYKKLWGWQQGRKINYDHLGLRFKMIFSALIKHDEGIFRGTFRRFMHFGVFYGFVILTIGTTVIAIQDHFGIPMFYGNRYLILSLLMDIFGLMAMIGIGMAAYKRYIDKPDHEDYTLDDAVLLILIFLILFTGFVIEGLRIYTTRDLWAWCSPVGLLFSSIISISGLSPRSSLSVHAALWYVHMLLAFGFMAYIPYSKLFHMFASSLNIFLRPFSPIGGLTPVELIFPDEKALGAARLEEFSKKQLLELDACISCGRCQKGCPAYMSGAPLSPRVLVQTIKRHSIEKSSFLRTRREAVNPVIPGNIISKETLWSCTTCGLCEDKCPIYIEHIKRIVDLRRSLSTESSNYPPEIQKVFKSISDVGNPWGIRLDASNSSNRVPLLSAKRKTDILYWLGCFGSYESRNQKVSQTMLKIFEKAGIDYAILGNEEKCCGDSVRRLGNEKLFQQLARETIQTLDSYSFGTIVTHCPHCYNTLKNDYPQFGGHYNVRHHSEYLLEIISSGKLTLKGAENNKCKVTYHDPCYLGRYNSIYEAPRQVLTSIPGLELVEMKNNRAKSFCCGAGGGRIWHEDTRNQRISKLLVEKALRTEPAILASACSMCLTTLTDVISEMETGIQTKDISEIVYEAI
ncbi:MAG: heterodisulfide reductase-related iron-sulfur binding cluster [Bacillota bacterium]|nr:heterodisulfide reductase-related iron-sulfur binding cluster [Bacillota bacterium]